MITCLNVKFKHVIYMIYFINFITLLPKSKTI